MEALHPTKPSQADEGVRALCAAAASVLRSGGCAPLLFPSPPCHPATLTPSLSGSPLPRAPHPPPPRRSRYPSASTPCAKMGDGDGSVPAHPPVPWRFPSHSPPPALRRCRTVSASGVVSSLDCADNPCCQALLRARCAPHRTVPYCRANNKLPASYSIDEFNASWPQAPFVSRPFADDHRTNELTPRSFRRL